MSWLEGWCYKHIKSGKGLNLSFETKDNVIEKLVKLLKMISCLNNLNMSDDIRAAMNSWEILFSSQLLADGTKNNQ